MLGEDFTELLSSYNFKNTSTTFPFVRSALCTAQMTASRGLVKDGVARLIVKSDFDRLKSKANMEKTEKAEKCLQDAWEVCKNHGLEVDQLALPFGRLMIRTALFLANKQNKSKEGVVFTDMDAINAEFSKEVVLMKNKGVVEEPEAPEVVEGVSDEAQPSGLEAAQDPVQIALSTYKVKVGENYIFSKEPQKVWMLKKMEPTEAVLEHQPFFGGKQEMKIPHANLKGIRIWGKAELPALHDAALCQAWQPCSSLQEEFCKAQAQVLLYEKVQELLGCYLGQK